MADLTDEAARSGGVAEESLPEIRPLADLAPGVRARVIRVTVDGDEPAARRLQDLGFTPGAVVDVVRRAPLRDPVVYRVWDYDICLRRAQAAHVHVVVIG